MKRQNSITWTRFVSWTAFFLMAASASAALLDRVPGDVAIEEVPLAKEATLDPAGRKIPLHPYVSGLRKKKVALFWAKVYVGQILSTPGLTPPQSIEEALETLSKQPAVAITLSFKRDVGTGRMKEAFEESLKANEIDPKEAALKPLFDAIEKSGGMKDKETTTLVLERNKDGVETFRFENGKGEGQQSALEIGTIRKILIMWLGKPADSGVKIMQEQFLGKKS
jgi:hypothetical protein